MMASLGHGNIVFPKARRISSPSMVLCMVMSQYPLWLSCVYLLRVTGSMQLTLVQNAA